MLIENAKIASITLGKGENTHGVLSSWIHVDYAGSGQGFGGYHLGGPCLALWVEGILDALRLESWDDLVGTVIRVRKSSTLGTIEAIGHALEDRWFVPEEVFKEIRESVED